MGLLKEIFFESRKLEHTLVSGYHVSWYVIKGETPLSVVEKLGLIIVRKSCPKSGLKKAKKRDDYVYIKAVKNDYILIVGLVWVGPQFEKHSTLFSELQFFNICAIYNDATTWLKYVQGKLVRSYCYEGAFGVYEDKGEMTKEEIELGFSKFWKSADYDETWTGED